jgi:hypothetical protein
MALARLMTFANWQKYGEAGGMARAAGITPSDLSRATTTLKEAPDLADLVVEERMTLREALGGAGGGQCRAGRRTAGPVCASWYTRSVVGPPHKGACMATHTAWGNAPLGPSGLVAFMACGHWWAYPIRTNAKQMQNLARFNRGLGCSFCTTEWQAATTARARGVATRVN